MGTETSWTSSGRSHALEAGATGTEGSNLSDPVWSSRTSDPTLVTTP